MPYMMTVKEDTVYGKGKYANAKGNTECVVFVQGVTAAPNTTLWTRGEQVKGAALETIHSGTAIATFDSDGKYPTDKLGRHAAIYLSHDSNGITVLDQWNAQGEVKKRVIRFNRPNGTKRSNDGDTFYVIK